ncbi:MAG: DUF3368 domain-containing protein [Verrucomicrobia bacterium]|jgi:predicted nucleic acid-binding protein|nr:DUF3368 domain-containing protein [Verrucomicrobiota bacterium]MBT7068997.1 DUF3368 domain-containing protein [Verrucomicrobiota bacterium]MBT7699190.1 DUF3368 domain-containing protein [Verrucomicrobiota bacterium]
MRKSREAFLFDTVALSNFALAGRLDLLLARYASKAEITPEVFDEIINGVVAGYFALKEIEDAVNDGLIALAPPRSSSAERQAYRERLHILGPGEASCIVHATFRGGTVVTDDRTARQCCSERNIPVTGTVGILKACCRDGALSIEEADDILDRMIDAGYYAPVQRINDLG